MSANDTQVGGGHYKAQAIEPWDLTVLNDLDAFQHEIIAYVIRHRAKNGIEDLQKARHWLDKYIEVETARRAFGPERMKVTLLERAMKKLQSIIER
jgi:hypothetical protein